MMSASEGERGVINSKILQRSSMDAPFRGGVCKLSDTLLDIIDMRGRLKFT